MNCGSARGRPGKRGRLRMTAVSVCETWCRNGRIPHSSAVRVTETNMMIRVGAKPKTVGKQGP
jgi:hypothetical protein